MRFGLLGLRVAIGNLVCSPGGTREVRGADFEAEEPRSVLAVPSYFPEAGAVYAHVDSAASRQGPAMPLHPLATLLGRSSDFRGAR